MDWLISIQRWLYGGMSEGMKGAVDLSSLPRLMGAASLFGIVHALMPGHGKSVLVSYHLGPPGKVFEGVFTGTILALTHVGLAVILVLAGIAVISRSVAGAGRAPAFEFAGAAMILINWCFSSGSNNLASATCARPRWQRLGDGHGTGDLRCAISLVPGCVDRNTQLAREGNRVMQSPQNMSSALEVRRRFEVRRCPRIFSY